MSEELSETEMKKLDKQLEGAGLEEENSEEKEIIFTHGEIDSLSDEAGDDKFEEKYIKILKSQRMNIGKNRIILGQLFLSCYDGFCDNINIFKDEGCFSKLKSFIESFKTDELRECIEGYGDGYEMGSHYEGKKIKSLVSKDRENMNKIISLFFDVFVEDD